MTTGDVPPAPRGRGRRLTKVTVNLVPRAVVALHDVVQLTEENPTDVINRAVQMYAYLSRAMAAGKLIFVEVPATGERERVVVL